MIISWITFAAPVRDANGGLTSDTASVRYRVLSRIQHSDPKRIKHQIVRASAEMKAETRLTLLAADVMVFSKSFAVANEGLAREALERGVPVVWDVCDNHYERADLGAHYKTMTALATRVVCATPEMAEIAGQYSQQPPVVLEDPYEGPRGTPAFAPGERMRLLWYGHPSNLDSLRAALPELARFSETTPLTLTVLTKAVPGLDALCAEVTAKTGGALSMAYAAWSLDDQWRALANCDAIIVPSLDTTFKTVKSANRMVEALWAGRPVVAHPVPAYAPFAAWTPVGPCLTEGLKALLADRPAVAGRIAEAQAYIEANFDPARIAAKWEALLADLPRPPRRA